MRSLDHLKYVAATVDQVKGELGSQDPHSTDGRATTLLLELGETREI